MADAYWRYAAADPRQQQAPPQQHSAAPVPGAHPGMGAASQMAAAAGVQQPMKRPRPADFSDIFRPFVGFREVRLVNKEPKHPGGDPIVLCFVDFAEATQAAIALDALQGIGLVGIHLP
nr:unnamed protein product [Digitaria exilis]